MLHVTPPLLPLQMTLHALPETGSCPYLDGGELCVCGDKAKLAPEPETGKSPFRGWYLCLACNKPNKPKKDK